LGYKGDTWKEAGVQMCIATARSAPPPQLRARAIVTSGPCVRRASAMGDGLGLVVSRSGMQLCIRTATLCVRRGARRRRAVEGHTEARLHSSSSCPNVCVEYFLVGV